MQSYLLKCKIRFANLRPYKTLSKHNAYFSFFLCLTLIVTADLDHNHALRNDN